MAKPSFPRADQLRAMREQQQDKWEASQAAARRAAKAARKAIPPKATAAPAEATTTLRGQKEG